MLQNDSAHVGDGPQLMLAVPEQFVDAIIEMGKALSPPTKILPALVVCAMKEQELQAIRLLFHFFGIQG